MRVGGAIVIKVTLQKSYVILGAFNKKLRWPCHFEAVVTEAVHPDVCNKVTAPRGHAGSQETLM